ncbi:BnaA09g46530D [Brassica napus]|uniref:non-specific serine/threonine protein kinase n=1 Tax=Brassica napus TaxID=3708 RepID=A0A078GN24_BRANA|nr:unnamed protein product [Brassica napus]CDY26624.1 BnaA09g46530D [Brassica napus]
MLTSTSSFPPECEEVLLYCSGGVSVIGVGNRTWMPDQLFKCLSTSGESKTSPALTQDSSVVPSVPYMSARVFKSPFTYSFPVASGRKFLRLYFYPNSYDGLNATLSLFSLSSGPYTLLRNFSASQTVQEMSLSYIVKEFVVNAEGGTLNLTFTPESTPSNAYAFVNGIEVTSMPDIYPNRVFTIVGTSKPIAMDKNTFLEMVYRVNIGGRGIYPFEDPLFRTWYQDLFIYSRGDRVTGAVVSESVHSYAPEEVYSSARAMESSLAEENLKFNLSWSFTVDSRFHYLIRLHFCEVAPGVDKSNQRVFSIFLNSATAEPKADIVEWSGGQGLALHRDYIVDVASYNRISVDLHPNEDSLYYDAILNGLEIFKLNTSDGNLAGPNPLPSPPVTPQPHKFKRVTPHRLKKALIIAGLVLSAVVVLGVVVAVAAAVTFKYRHRRTAQSPQPEAATACCRHFSLAEVEAATENFHESRLIGVGGFGKVYRGQLDGGDVAIKRATPKSNHDLHQVLTEIETLSKLRHRHLVSLTGCCEEDGELILIYDFMSEGTLKDHLHGSSSNVPLLPWKRRVEICIGAARGLHYLHTGASQTIVHRDVKSTNILLDQNFVAKVSDFGLAKYYISRDNTQVISNAKGTVGYMDPEYYGGERLTVKSDIYAFGIVLLEALCARPAVDVSSADQRVSLATWAQNFYKKGMLDQMVDPRLKGDINSQSLKKFAETAINCVRRSGVERPSTAAVLVNLELALKLQEDGLDRKKTICRESDMDSDVHEAGYSRSSGRSNGSKHFDGLSLRHALRLFQSLRETPFPVWRSGPWNGQIFIGLPDSISLLFLDGFNVSNDNQGTFLISYATDSFMHHFNLDPDGALYMRSWNTSTRAWTVDAIIPSTTCDAYNRCGPFASCGLQEVPPCKCVKGYVPRNSTEWNRGIFTNECVRRVPLKCNVSNGGGGKEDGFFKMQKMKLPANVEKSVANEKDCPKVCLENCSCIAYAYDRGIGCMLWSGSLVDMQSLLGSGIDLYIRVSHSEFSDLICFLLLLHLILRTVLITSSVLGVVFVAMVCVLLACRKFKKRPAPEGDRSAELLFQRMEELTSGNESSSNQVKLKDLPLFEFEVLATSTDNFSLINKLGQGGFGPVYKGILPNGQELAVKRLSRASGQGLEELMNEVVVISKLQHRNLVKLLGCCIEGEERLLVYEYMSKKSLDAYLFDPMKQNILDWKTRFNIMEGICRGLLYLHRDSRLKIIHRDLKASNILLDENLNPKISDFGLARVFRANEDEANTTRVVGTYGYMSPEYAMEGFFSEKSDVFSLGVIFLEIISGKKNSHKEDNNLNLLAYAWKLWNDGKANSLADPTIFNECFEKEFTKCVQIGLLCVQEVASDRPNVSTMIWMLTTENTNLPEPKQPAFIATRRVFEAESSGQSSQKVSINDVSLTAVTGR